MTNLTQKRTQTQTQTRWNFAILGLWIAVLACIASLGCRSSQPIKLGTPATQPAFQPTSTTLEPDDLKRTLETPFVERPQHRPEFGLAPLTSASDLPSESHPLTLDETIQLGLQDTKVLRGLGAQVVRAPTQSPTIFDPSIQATDPIFGIQAALAQFDAQLAASVDYNNNDDVFNNAIVGGGATEVQQDLFTSLFSLNKTTATGTQFALRSNVQYDSSNAPSLLFDSVWTTLWEAEARQPLLQGRGLQFNRIAGPNATPGFRSTGGLLVSRINNDISIAQFEQSVQTYVNEVSQAYWDLYFAYRNFEALKMGRDGSLETWNTVKARFDNDLEGGEADKEAQAREQYYQFQQQLLAALNGDNSQGVTGVLQAEADLRRLIGLPQSDGAMLRPVDEPVLAKTIYEWPTLVNAALDTRSELREQQWRIKQRELQLLASKNFLLPRFCLLYTSPSPRDATLSRMPSSA